MPNNDRPKVGPADPETRRKLLRKALDEPTRATGVAPRAEETPEPAKKKGNMNLRDALDSKKKRDPVHRGETVDEIVDRAVKGAKKDPY